MNVVQSISAREKGLGQIKGYDIALTHLKCYNEDVYKGVAPNPEAADYNAKPPVFACKFSSAPGYEQVIALANEDGRIALQNTELKYNTEEPFEGTQAHNNAIFDLAWMPQELKIITASGERTACLWDVSSDLKKLQVFHGHTHSIKSAVFRHDDKAVFATGARDGAIMIWDIRANHSGQPKPDNVIFNAHELRIPYGAKQRRTPSQSTGWSASQSVTALVFQDDFTLISSSAGDGLLKAWDMRKNYSVHTKEPIAKHIMHYGGKSNTYNGFTSLLVCPAGITLYASCVDKTIYAYNISSYNPNPIAEYYGHGSDNKVISFFVKACLSPDGEYLASGSDDEMAYIWRTRKPGPPLIKLSGHRDEVTCIAWCGVGGTKIVTCSDDCYHRIWRVRPDPIDECEKSNIFGSAELCQEKQILPQWKNPPITTTPRSVSSNAYYSNNNGSVEKVDISDNQQTSNKLKSNLFSVQNNLEYSPRRSTPDSRAARKLYFSHRTKTDSTSPTTSHNEDLNSASVTCTNERVLAAPFSPTSGLPNFVVDGTAPHLLANSPQKSRENIDWLTKIRKRKCAEKSGGRIEDSPSPKNRKTPTRRSSRLTRPKSGDLKKTPKSSPLFIPAITNFYNNLNLSNAKVPSPCSSR